MSSKRRSKNEQKSEEIGAIKTLLVGRVEKTFEAGVRLILCDKAYQQYDDMPDEAATRKYIDMYRDKVGKRYGREVIEEFINEFIAVDEIFPSECIADGKALLEKYLNCEISERKSLIQLGVYCLLMSLQYDEYFSNADSYDDLPDLVLFGMIELEKTLMDRSHEAISYWTEQLMFKKTGKKGGEREKINMPILEVVKRFIKEKKDRIDTANTVIGKSFKRSFKEPPYPEIIVNSTQYGIGYERRKITCYCVRGKSTDKKDKYHNKSISYDVFVKTYIRRAKSEVREEMSINTGR
jgi:hypothetical protein